MIDKFFLPLMCVLLLVCAGCSTVDSEDLRTSGIYKETSIVVEDSLTRVLVRLRTGPALDADRVILSPGDQLTATLSGSITALFSEGESTGAYRGSFSQSVGGTELTVALLRANDDDAPASTVTLPGNFQLSAPDAGETFNAGESITVAWSPAAPANVVDVTYDIDCTIADETGLPRGASYGRSYTVVDSGTHTAQINDILNVLGTQDELIPDVACLFQATVTRVSNGTIDPALTRGGSIRAPRRKSVLLNVVP